MATIALQHSSLAQTSHSSSSSLDQIRHQELFKTKETVTVTATRSPTSPSAESTSSERLWPSKCMKSRLYPADRYREISTKPPVRSIEASELASALQYARSQPLPESDMLFPWIHGVHPENHLQQHFFYSQLGLKPRNSVPQCFRGIMLVKAGGDLSAACLKGSVAPRDILPVGARPGFCPSDPKTGFSIRNFGIQVPKFATVCDIVVYGDGQTTHQEKLELAKRISAAQLYFRQTLASTMGNAADFPVYHTFLVQSPFAVFENFYPELVAVDTDGDPTEHCLDFCELERREMALMSKASEISHNVYLGSTADAEEDLSKGSGKDYHILIEAGDHAAIPHPQDFVEMMDNMAMGRFPQRIDYPGSNSLTWKNADPKYLLDFCQWVYAQAHGIDDSASPGSPVSDSSESMTGHKVLIFCGDGYTESSLLGLAYIMYAEGLAANEAWLALHKEKGRNFFTYQEDVRLLQRLQPLLLAHSPTIRRNPSLRLSSKEPRWFTKMDGSFPSRILPHLYLGNLEHANNGSMLKALGIKRVLSIGEPVSWTKEEQRRWGLTNGCVSGVQDNGIDSLIAHIERCLKFIEIGREKGEATLVHCRVGVSRSATIVIAEVMQYMNVSLPRAYCYVRARRLNVIIQPHCRFMYELLKWEESKQKQIKREIDWHALAYEIYRLNQPHTG